MPVTYRILPNRGLVYVRFTGHARVEDSFAALARFATDPAFRPELAQLIDLSGVTGFESDYMELFRLHAAKAGVFTPPRGGGNTLTVYIAPGEVHLRLAREVQKSFDGLPGLIHRLTRSEAQALEVLGLPERSVAELMEQSV